MQKVNLNQRIVARLTPFGKEQYRRYLWQFRDNKHVSQNVPDVLEMGLWEFAQIFGPVLYNGNPQVVVVDNEIGFVPAPDGEQAMADLLGTSVETYREFKQWQKEQQ